MDTDQQEKTFVSQEVDYLGFLSAKLRDLRGFPTLAYELIQNSDDVPETEEIVFDITKDAFVITNNSQFSYCGQIKKTCPWKVEKKHSCDFHRMRNIAGGDKREVEDTTGAFGIGFISVYQVTDYPEIMSSGQKWIIRPDRKESKRIEIIKPIDIQGTCFRLPWAFDPGSTIRKELKIEPVKPEQLPIFLQQLKTDLPKAIFFLKRLRKIEIRYNGQIEKVIKRDPTDDYVIIEKGSEKIYWKFHSGSFYEDEQILKEKYPNQIEVKRRSDVTIALPNKHIQYGRLFAYLPSQETLLPFHINADFFPSSDRKKIIFESDFQSEWNRAAMKAAANILGESFHELPNYMGHKKLWQFLNQIHKAKEEAEKGQIDKSFVDFWDNIASRTNKVKTIYTTQKKWDYPSSVLLLEKKDEEEAIYLYEAMKIQIVHSDLRGYFTLLRSEDVGINLLDLSHIVDALDRMSLNQHIEKENIPEVLKSDESKRLLWKEIDLLFRRRRKGEKKEALKQKLLECAIVPDINNCLIPLKDLYFASPETIELFSPLFPEIHFADNLGEKKSIVLEIIPRFDVKAAIGKMSKLSAEILKNKWDNRMFDPKTFFEWFEDQKEILIRDRQTQDSFKRLPIFPSSGQLRALNKLAIPGDFQDPLKLSKLVDLDKLGGKKEFLKELDVLELNFSVYACEQVPLYFKSTEKPDKKIIRELVSLLAENFGRYQDDRNTKANLKKCDLVECTDGIFRNSHNVYFQQRSIIDVLGEKVFMTHPRSSDTESISNFLKWLGVAKMIKSQDIIERIKYLTSDPPSDEKIDDISRVFNYLSENWTKIKDTHSIGLEDLKKIPWLATESQDNTWYKSSEVNSVFQDYLFSTQGNFLSFPRDLQRKGSKFLQFLEIESKPTSLQVVNHLLFCCKKNQQVNEQVYHFLNNCSDDKALINLEGEACLLLRKNDKSFRYVNSNQVYWGKHSFGRYKSQLPTDFRKYTSFLDRLGVKQTPDYKDAIALILEISIKFGDVNSPLDEESLAVLMECWRIIEKSFQNDSTNFSDLDQLKKRKTIPDPRNILQFPEYMFFEDRPGLSDKFNGLLTNHAITRHEGTWRAMQNVGVKPLSIAVESYLVECDDPIENNEIKKRIEDRLPQLSRVLDTQTASFSNIIDLSSLKTLSYKKANNLSVIYKVEIFNQVKESEKENITAYFSKRDECIYVSYCNDNIPWALLSREIAIALNPSSEPGLLALGIKEILSSESFQEADSILDELGYARLHKGTTAPISNQNEGEISGLGDDVMIEITPPEKVQKNLTKQDEATANIPKSDYSTSSEKQRGTQSGVEIPPPIKPKKSNSPNIEDEDSSFGDHNWHDHNADQGSQKGDGPNKTEGTKSYGSNRNKLASNTNSKIVSSNDRKPVYVGKEREFDSNKQREHKERATEIGNRGENYVLENSTKYLLSKSNKFEKAPINNKGYDILENDLNGEIVRYIEVKTLTGGWSEEGVGVTESQLKWAQEHDNWWLFVVENINTQNTTVHIFENPVQQANRFMFDHSWKQLAENTKKNQSVAPKEKDKYLLLDGIYEVSSIEPKGKFYKMKLKETQTGKEITKKFDPSWEKC